MKNIIYLIFLALIINSCNKDADQIDELNSNSSTIGVDGGTITTASGASIIIPPGALASSTEITITSYDNQMDLPDTIGMMGNFAGGLVLGPDDLRFQTPITITIPLNLTLDNSVNEVKLFYLDNGDPLNSNYPANYLGWQQTDFIGIVNVDRQSVTAQIDHFSEFVVQLNFGSSTLDIMGEAAATIGNNGLGVDLESYTKYFESNVAGIGDVHSYDLPMDDNYNYDPDSYGYDDYQVVGIRYELYHDFGAIFENPLIIFHGRRPDGYSFFYNYEGDNMSNDKQFIYHLFINVYYEKTSVLDLIEIDVPTVTTSFLKDDEDKVAYAGGEVTDAGEISDNWIEYVTERGIYLNGDKIVLGKGVGSFVTELQDLEPQEHYILRAYAINSAGTGYGEEVRFVLDIDENIYRSVIIGEQEWMAENLKTARLNDGTLIGYTKIDDDTEHVDYYDFETGTRTWYDNKESNNKVYGTLYSADAVKTEKLCPTGWHVPTENDFLILTDFAGGYEQAGGKFKAPGTTYWNSPNTGATNEFGLTALPGGRLNRERREGSPSPLDHADYYRYIGEIGMWWTSTTINGSPSDALKGVGISYNSSEASFGNQTNMMLHVSCRCVKD
jgi:uncharacterized protein (TIGR02145 family)